MLVANCRGEWNCIEKKTGDIFSLLATNVPCFIKIFQIHHPQKFQSLEKQIIVSFHGVCVMGTIQINW